MTRIGYALAAVVVTAAVGGCSVSVAGTAAPDPLAAAAPLNQSAPAPGTPAPTGDAFADAQNRFAIRAPTGWAVDTSGAQGTAVVFLAPSPTRSAAGSFSANINVIVVPSSAGLDSTVTGSRSQLRSLADYRSTVDESATLRDGTPAHVLGGTFTDSKSGFALRNLQLFAVSANSTVVVTGTVPAGDWDAYGATFDAALRTLTFDT